MNNDRMSTDNLNLLGKAELKVTHCVAHGTIQLSPEQLTIMREAALDHYDSRCQHEAELFQVHLDNPDWAIRVTATKIDLWLKVTEGLNGGNPALQVVHETLRDCYQRLTRAGEAIQLLATVTQLARIKYGNLDKDVDEFLSKAEAVTAIFHAA